MSGILKGVFFPFLLFFFFFFFFSFSLCFPFFPILVSYSHFIFSSLVSFPKITYLIHNLRWPFVAALQPSCPNNNSLVLILSLFALLFLFLFFSLIGKQFLQSHVTFFHVISPLVRRANTAHLQLARIAAMLVISESQIHVHCCNCEHAKNAKNEKIHCGIQPIPTSTICSLIC